MGYKYNDKRIRCPLFHGVVKTTNSQFIGIECEALDVNLGFKVIPVLRLRNTEDLKDYTELFCDDLYEQCPYYQAHRQIGGA